MDNDTLPDAWEHRYSIGPRQEIHPHNDLDSDGLSTLDEYLIGTHPKIADSDGDGVKDGDEVAEGRDPAVHDRPLDVVNSVWNMAGTQLIAGLFAGTITAPLTPDQVASIQSALAAMSTAGFMTSLSAAAESHGDSVSVLGVASVLGSLGTSGGHIPSPGGGTTTPLPTNPLDEDSDDDGLTRLEELKRGRAFQFS